QAAGEQHQVAPGETATGDPQPRPREVRDPYDREQQRDARQHRERKPGSTGGRAPRCWQPLDQDGDEDDVVDAENDLEQRQREERQPEVWTGDQSTASPLRQVIERGLLDRGEQVLGGESEVERDGARDVDRGVSARDDADQQGRGEAAQHRTAEEQQRHYYDGSHHLGHDGARQRLVDGLIDY